MIKYSYILLLVLILSPTRLCLLHAEESEVAEWRQLFNGKDLSGWSGDEKFWRVEDEVIVGETTADNPARRNTFLIWHGQGEKVEKPADYELKFEYRIASEWANSGVQVRSVERDGHVVAGYQPDIATEGWITGILFEERGRGILARRGERVSIDSEGNRRVERFAEEAALLEHIKPGEWNEYHVVAEGPVIRSLINGALMHELTDESPQARRDGVIAFQLHTGPPMTIHFRNIRLKEIAQ